MSRLLRPAIESLVFAVVLLLHAPPAPAQLTQCEGALGTTRNVKETTELTVRLPHALTEEDLLRGGGPDRWVLVDISTPMPERPLRVVGVRPDRVDLSLPIADLFLTMNRPLHEYRLFAPFLTYQGCKPEAVPEGRVMIREPGRNQPGHGASNPAGDRLFQEVARKGARRLECLHLRTD